MAKTTITPTTTTVNTFLHHLGESKSRELNASSGCCWSMTYTARRRTGRMRIAAATSEKTHRRIVEKQATICHKLQAASCKLSCAELLVVLPRCRSKAAAARLVFHLFSLHSNSSCNSPWQCNRTRVSHCFHGQQTFAGRGELWQSLGAYFRIRL